MGQIIDKELISYKEALPSLLESHRNQWIAMKEGKVISSNIDKNIVINEVLSKGLSFGDFLLKQVLPENEVIQRFFSRVG